MDSTDTAPIFRRRYGRWWPVLFTTVFLTACGGESSSGSDTSSKPATENTEVVEGNTDNTNDDVNTDSEDDTVDDSSDTDTNDDSGDTDNTDTNDDSGDTDNTDTDTTDDNSSDDTVDDGSNDDTASDDNTDLVLTAEEASRFLTQATFGPVAQEVESLSTGSVSDWYHDQMDIPASYLMPILGEYRDLGGPAIDLEIEAATFGFWRNAITGEDQLRQRIAFALSELLVVSNGGGETLTDIPEAVIYYQDLLIDQAFGNYRDILESVTYSPAMGYYLTYLGSEKGDPETGRMPDENYAREILQLFTIGLVELNMNGSAKLDSEGNAIETYNNTDVTGLARVFTGLNPNYAEEDNEESLSLAAMPMVVEDPSHSDLEKNFLGHSIPENTDGPTSITLALDAIFAHENLAPFVGKQLIQRLVSSNPSPAYIERVSNAFEQGIYTLPDGSIVGESRRGDLAATVAAILFDTEARELAGETGGKIREPILRFTHWARAFNLLAVTPEYTWQLWSTSDASDLAQHSYRSPSVFNFFRPGYTAPGSLSGEQGLTAPELQITNASSIPGYINFMTFFITRETDWVDVDELQAEYNDEGLPLDANLAVNSFQADYSIEIALADNIDALMDHLDLTLTYGSLSDETRLAIADALALLPDDDEEDLVDRVRLAILMIMTSPDYLVQR